MASRKKLLIPALKVLVWVAALVPLGILAEMYRSGQLFFVDPIEEIQVRTGIAALILLSSLLAVAYVWRVVETAYFEEAPAVRGEVGEAPLAMLIPLWLLVAATIYFGVDADLTAGLAQEAAVALLGGDS